MRAPTAALVAITALLWLAPAASANDCPSGLGVSRIVEIDTTAGPLFGDITRYQKEASVLGPKEVVLTFDDGPMPWVTKSILDTLDRFCTKATFFSVGRMAVAYPEMVKEVMARGHTMGGHTWSHPLNLKRLPLEKAVTEIERGFSAIAMAAGRPIAPFFRFPGLSDSPQMLAHLQKRGIGAFTVDVVSDDSYIGDPKRLVDVTLRRVEARQGGIMLFHDIKAATAKALPTILSELKARGYKVVHLRSTHALQPLPDWDAELGASVAKAVVAKAGKAPLLPFYGTIGPERVAAAMDATPITQIAPEARNREAAEASGAGASSSKSSRRTRVASAGSTARATAKASANSAAIPGWSTRVKRTSGRRQSELY